MDPIRAGSAGPEVTGALKHTEDRLRPAATFSPGGE
jgi:hypothetical protein